MQQAATVVIDQQVAASIAFKTRSRLRGPVERRESEQHLGCAKVVTPLLSLWKALTMSSWFSPLLFLLAGSTEDQLRKQIEFL